MDEPVLYMVLSGTVILALLVMFIVSFVLIYKSRQRKYILEKKELQNLFEHEKLISRLETQEETLNHISQEIHDNIGQVLSLVRLQLNTLGTNPPEEKINETDELLGKAITDLRMLSHSLHTDRIKNIGIEEAIRQSLDELKKSGYTTCLNCTNENNIINEEASVIIYRMVQEALNNIVKHAGATVIKAGIGFEKNKTIITITDNGKGFDPEKINGSAGIGIKNIMARAKVINADVEIKSIPGNTSVIISF